MELESIFATVSVEAMNSKPPKPQSGNPDRKQATSDQAPPEPQEALPVSAPLKREISEALSEVIGPEKAGKASAAVVRVLATREEYYSGPTPPPAHLREIEDIIPGGAERFLRMAEIEQARIDFCDRTTVAAYARNSTLGLVFGLIVMLVLIIGAIYCATIGERELAYVLAGASALSIVPQFINAWKREHPKTLAPQPEKQEKKGR